MLSLPPPPPPKRDSDGRLVAVYWTDGRRMSVQDAQNWIDGVSFAVQKMEERRQMYPARRATVIRNMELLAEFIAEHEDEPGANQPSPNLCPCARDGNYSEVPGASLTRNGYHDSACTMGHLPRFWEE